MSRTFFAYQVAHKFGPFKGRRYYTDKSTPRANDTLYVVSGSHNAEGRVDYSLEGKFRVARRNDGGFPLPRADGELHTFKVELELSPIQVPGEPIALVQMDWYDREDMRKNFGSQQNFNPLPVGYEQRFSSALAEFGDGRTHELDRDITEIMEASDLSESEKDTLVKARLGQGRFRRAVTDLWNNGPSCALTEIALPEILTASHIKAWKDCTSTDERLDGANGILLAANMDRLFDRHLISFRCTGSDFELVVSKRLTPVVGALGIKLGSKLRSAKLSPSEFERVARYMEGHHSKFLEQQKVDLG